MPRGEGVNGKSQNVSSGTLLVVEWLRLHTSNAGSVVSIPGWGTKIPRTAGRSQKKKFETLINGKTSHV